MEPTLATRWFYKHLAQRVVRSGVYTCCVCGLPCADPVARHKVLRSTFTDYDVLRVRLGQDVCAACAWYFDHQELRRSGWWLSREEARAVGKAAWLPLLRSHVEEGVPADAYYLIKPPGLAGRHLALYAPLAASGSHEFPVQFGALRVTVNEAFLRFVAAVHRLREVHAWREIESGHYSSHRILMWPDHTEFIRLRDLVYPWQRSAEMALAKFLWVKE